MAISQPVTEVYKRILREVASSLIALRRVVNPDLSVSYPTTVTYVTTLFEVDSEGTKLARIGEENDTVFELTPAEVYHFFTTPVTASGVSTTLGELLCFLTDNLIRAQIDPLQTTSPDTFTWSGPETHTETITLAAKGGVAPYTWTLVDADASGVTLAGDVLTIPWASFDTFEPVVKVQDSVYNTIEKKLTLTNGE